MSNVML